MFKTLFFTLFLLATTSAFAKVQARWLTVASVVIDDGKTRILFDPAWTRPTWKHWLNIENLKSDEKLVRDILEKNQLTQVDAVFASHSHFDHVLDAPMVAKVAGATFYTDESSERLTRAYQDPSMKTVRIVKEQEIKIGDFSVLPLTRQHAQILHLFHFLPGAVPENTKLGFYDYHIGETWYYLIKHPDGVILLDQGSKANLEIKKFHSKNIDVLIQGIANRVSDEDLIDGYPKEFSPKVFMPLHFDNFFLEFQSAMNTFLPGIRLEDMLTKMKKAYPSIRVDRPEYAKEIVLLEGK